MQSPEPLLGLRPYLLLDTTLSNPAEDVEGLGEGSGIRDQAASASVIRCVFYRFLVSHFYIPVIL